MIPLTYAVLCACGVVTDMRETRGERCPACGAREQMLSLARVLNPNPSIGTITFILASGENDVPRHEEDQANA